MFTALTEQRKERYLSTTYICSRRSRCSCSCVVQDSPSLRPVRSYSPEWIGRMTNQGSVWASKVQYTSFLQSTSSASPKVLLSPKNLA